MTVLDIPESGEYTGMGLNSISTRFDVLGIVCKACQRIKRHQTYISNLRLQFCAYRIHVVVTVYIHVLRLLAIGEICHVAMVYRTNQQEQTKRRSHQIIFRVDLFHIAY